MEELSVSKVYILIDQNGKSMFYFKYKKNATKVLESAIDLGYDYSVVSKEYSKPRSLELYDDEYGTIIRWLHDRLERPSKVSSDAKKEKDTETEPRKKTSTKSESVKETVQIKKPNILPPDLKDLPKNLEQFALENDIAFSEKQIGTVFEPHSCNDLITRSS